MIFPLPFLSVFLQSVVMTVHNAAEWLGEALDSILSQTFSGKMELSIFDDASKVSHAPLSPVRAHVCVRRAAAPPTRTHELLSAFLG